MTDPREGADLTETVWGKGVEQEEAEQPHGPSLFLSPLGYLSGGFPSRRACFMAPGTARWMFRTGNRSTAEIQRPRVSLPRDRARRRVLNGGAGRFFACRVTQIVPFALVPNKCPVCTLDAGNACWGARDRRLFSCHRRHTLGYPGFDQFRLPRKRKCNCSD